MLKNKLEDKDEGLNLQRMTNWKLNKVSPDTHPWLVPYVLLVIKELEEKTKCSVKTNYICSEQKVGVKSMGFRVSLLGFNSRPQKFSFYKLVVS